MSGHSDGSSVALEVVLERINKQLEKRLQTTKAKCSQINKARISERSDSFDLGSYFAFDTENPRRVLFDEVLATRQRALESRNCDLERRLIVNETVNKHFQDVIAEFETDLLDIVKDALAAETDRVRVLKQFKDEKDAWQQKYEVEERHSRELLQNNTKLEADYAKLVEEKSDAETEVGELRVKMKNLEDKNRNVEQANEALRKRLHQTEDDLQNLQERFDTAQVDLKALREEKRTFGDTMEMEKRRVRAVKDEYESRIEHEREQLKSQLCAQFEEKLAEEKVNAYGKVSKMKASFEEQLRAGADNVEQWKELAKKYKQAYTELLKNNEQKLAKALFEAKQTMERKYMNLNRVQVQVTDVGHPFLEQSPNLENLPQAKLREWRANSEDSTPLSLSSASSGVIIDVGLCISFYDFEKIGASYLMAGDAASYTPVEFRYIVFQPFRGEILQATISSSDIDGVRLTMSFFSDILIPQDKLPQVSKFEEQDGIWFWECQVDDEGGVEKFYMEPGKIVKFRVIDVKYKSVQPGASTEIKVMEVIGSMSEPGLGCTSWWEAPADVEMEEEEEVVTKEET